MGLNPGDTLQGGKYTIEKRLRVGLTSVSYLAKRDDGSRWAIKVLDPQVLVGLSEAERNRAESLFMQEAVKLARCSGTPHIVKSEMPFKEGELVCLPVEYLSGNSLAERPQPRLTEAVALNYIRQIGEALAVVHGQGLVHRDIWPSNIFLRIEGNRVDAVLAGFGLAVDCDTALTRTRAKELVDGFSPYELYGRGQTVGAYTDVYSLAATLYELLTGVVPVSALDRKNGTQALEPLQIKNPDVTGGVVKAIEAGMVVWPTEKRPQSVAKWLKMLKAGQRANVLSAANLEVKQKSGQTTVKEPVNWAKWSVIVALLAGLAPVMMWFVDRLDDDSGGQVPEPSSLEKSPTEENYIEKSPQDPEIEGSEQKSNSPDTAP
ncbi:MAG: serine/threonine-protein kinase [Cyanobacteria bacterium P01_D01_bin.36]